MKTKFKIAGIATMLFALLALMPKTSKAQCLYQLNNMLNCPVDVVVEIYTPMPQCPLCTSMPFNIPPGGAIPFDACAMGCPQPCNIVVKIVQVGGLPIAPPVQADFSTPPPGNPILPFDATCSPTGHGFINYDPPSNTFSIHP